MKLRVSVDGEDYALDIRPAQTGSEYTLQGVTPSSGTASTMEVMPGVFSVLLGTKSFTVHLAPSGDELEVSSGSRRYRVSVADTRDRSGAHKKAEAAGPVELRAQMPGKIIKVLVQRGAAVHAGQGLVIVEAMKMQNEMKSPKDGVVSNIRVSEGGTVAAGDALIVVE
ncbi:MAG TPA: biotin/lipoyl-containing protein [Bryobacteraceae bacterium]|nr:biotin/lipoyl-containing protein [Bryobacteraceae bacterium]